MFSRIEIRPNDLPSIHDLFNQRLGFERCILEQGASADCSGRDMQRAGDKGQQT